jgi:AMP phosphorylase
LRLKTSFLDLEAGGKYIVVMGEKEAKNLGVISSDRVMLKTADTEAMAILNTALEFPEGVIGVFREVKSGLELQESEFIDVFPAESPESLVFIREKIMGEKLLPWKIEMIVEDVVERHLSDIELASFVTALQTNGMSIDEVEALSKAMVGKGKTISFDKKHILDKHSIGGVPGDMTTLLVVPIVAAAGYTIPKSSSRAITSPAGTADRMEALAPVDLRIEDIIETVKKVDACIVWGGALDLAPADDIFIQVEYPLSIDPLLLPSILSKKKAMGSTHVVIDIPTGRGAKIKTIGEAHQLSGDFINLGNRLGMHIECAVTEGEQPIGSAVGPVLEAREALEALIGRESYSLVDKATSLAGILFEMMGEENGKEKALNLIESGRAEEKMRQIIMAQGGDPNIRPEDLEVGEKWVDVKAEQKGRVLWINNRYVAQIARAAGAPNDSGAGLILKVRLGDMVVKGDTLYRIHAESFQRLNQAVELSGELRPIGVGSKLGEPMLIKKIREVALQRPEFILER